MSNKRSYELLDHYRSMKQVAIAKRLGVNSKLFEACAPDELEENNSAGTVYGYDAKQEVGHDAKQGSQKAMQSIDDPKNGSSASPNLIKKGTNKHKEKGMLEEVDELEEEEELEENNSAGTVYGDDAKQEVGHDSKQGSQKAMQSIDDPKNGSSAKPNLVNKGSNKHKEDGMLEEVDELEERWDHTPDHRNFARPKSPQLNEAVNRLIKNIKLLKKSQKRGRK